MRTVLARLRALAERENGQTAAEYAVVLGVVTLAAVAALLLLGSNITDALNTISNLV
jgi:Flp pilus assembly pilin Flp